MKTDPLTIPPFLDRTGGKTLEQLLAARAETDSYEDQRYKFAEPNPNRDPDRFLRPKGCTEEEWAEARVRRNAAQTAKKTASLAKHKDRQLAKLSVPTDLKGRPLYSLPDANKTASGVTVSGGGKKIAAKTAENKVAVATDDIGLKVSQHCGTDMTKLKKFTVANGVWKDGDQNAKNFGLARMTVVNRLRGKLKREPKFKVIWS